MGKEEVICSFITQETPSLTDIATRVIFDLINNQNVTTFLIARRTPFERAVFDVLTQLHKYCPDLRVIYVRPSKIVYQHNAPLFTPIWKRTRPTILRDWLEERYQADVYAPDEVESVARAAGFEIRDEPSGNFMARLFADMRRDTWMMEASHHILCYLPYAKAPTTRLAHEAEYLHKKVHQIGFFIEDRANLCWEVESELNPPVPHFPEPEF